MKKFLSLCMCICLMAGCVACGSTKTDNREQMNTTTTEMTEGKILVAYFSATGNTRPIAEYIAEITGADVFEIIPANLYSDADLNYNDDNCRANKEQADDSARPEIKGTIDNFSQYDTVFIGHPIWWGMEPRIIDTFMESYDFSGKTVVNFCTSGGSGISTASENLQGMAEKAKWLDGMRFETNASKEDVQKWIDSLNY